MKEILTGKQSKDVDEISINKLGIPSLVLMERAALSVAEEIVKIQQQKEMNNILIVCGVGNNGADGLAVARILQNKMQYNKKIKVYIFGNEERATNEYRKQRELLNAIGFNECKHIAIFDESEKSRFQRDIEHANLIVDALFGIGLSRNIEGIFKEAVNSINQTNARIVSVDIPSGLCANSGRVYNCAIHADVTITFGREKTGLYLNKARDYTGRIIAVDIGFPDIAYEIYLQNNKGDAFVNALEQSDLEQIPKRVQSSNKGTYGKIVLIGGNKEMIGAVYFSAKASYRMGVGMVFAFSCKENIPILKSMLPEAIYGCYEDLDLLKQRIQKSDVLIVGPGLGVDKKACELVQLALKSKKPAIIDADALNIISKNTELLNLFHKNVVVTPHIKEMSRLISKSVDDIANHMIEVARDFSTTYHCVCVLKDATTIISSKKTYLNTIGNSGMSTAGSGDALSGVIAALMATGMPCEKAAVFGVYMHAYAGDIAAHDVSEYSMIASDLVESITKIFKNNL